MSDRLTPSRLEAFSDGVIAVIITIMVLELKIPTLIEQPDHLAALRAALPLLVIYLLSFIQIGIYWVNHHYLIDDLRFVTHGVLWSNLAFLFGLSLIPFGTEWVGVRGVLPVPVAVYCSSFVLASVIWVVLSTVICRTFGIVAAAGPMKQTISAIVNISSVGVAFYYPHIALAMITLIAVWWLLPPARIVQQARDLHKGAPTHIP